MQRVPSCNAVHHQAKRMSELSSCNVRRWGDCIYAEDPANDRYYMFLNEVLRQQQGRGCS